MRIAIDGHSIGTALAGNETYSSNLIESLAAIDADNEYTIYVTRSAAVDRLSGRWPNFKVRRIFPHTPLIRVPLALSIELRRRPVDLLHVQFTAPPWAPCKVVATIHDLSYEHLPETFTRRGSFQIRLTTRRTARTADHVITPSEFSRQDIVSTYGLAENAVTSIPLAASSALKPATRTEIDRVRLKYGFRDDPVLCVGSIQPRKNLVRLIRAYAGLLKDGADLPQLVLVGKRAWLSAESISAIRQSGCEGRVIVTGYVPEEDLAALYSAAKCFIYPSFFEGFGLPLLEAMQCGTPVIAGNRTSLPEVVGEAGVMVDPLDVSAIAAGLSRVLGDAKLRQELSLRGLERARQFSWRETARRTLDVYQRVMGHERAAFTE
ncbi:MAG TPA: glycosyltransferase family 1 protein [Pyrinomonadaceae bacterium]|jgi:glycosyltransferase involved in cell wall biosynthesis|nr:glycosyltransferase family 1 protein [Pyrinomonadaceae bacterium]